MTRGVSPWISTTKPYKTPESIGFGLSGNSSLGGSVTFSLFFVISFVHPFFSSLSWPGSVAEQCSRHRRKGTHCLSPSRRLRPSSASLRAAGVGCTAQGTRKACPCGGRGPRHGQHSFVYFCQNKSGSSAGRDPSTTHND